MLSGEKILITGVTGKAVLPIAVALARTNEVWGMARFSDPGRRAQVEALGITPFAADIGSGQFDGLPTNFTRLGHFAWMRAGLDQLQEAIRVNAEGCGLIMQHCQSAKSALVVSSQGIYTPHDDPFYAYKESDSVGRGATPYAATSPATKLGMEAIARFCARAFNLPTTIARLNTVVGVPGAYYSQMIKAVLAGDEVVVPWDPNPHAPIHTLDMQAQVHSLLEAATVPATITNWGGDEVVVTQEVLAHLKELSGVEARIKVRFVEGAPKGNNNDNTVRRAITGPCKVKFRDAYVELYKAATATGGPLESRSLG
jgi:UDP-glucuronate 4-epimerase